MGLFDNFLESVENVDEAQENIGGYWEGFVELWNETTEEIFSPSGGEEMAQKWSDWLDKKREHAETTILDVFTAGKYSEYKDRFDSAEDMYNQFENYVEETRNEFQTTWDNISETFGDVEDFEDLKEVITNAKDDLSDYFDKSLEDFSTALESGTIDFDNSEDSLESSSKEESVKSNSIEDVEFDMSNIQSQIEKLIDNVSVG